MAMNFSNLDDRTRKYMLDEFDKDVTAKRLYLSPRLNDEGRKKYETILRFAIQQGNEALLAQTLASYINEYEQKSKPSGGYTMARIPITASEMLAEGEFNRYYCRGVCRKTLEEGLEEVEVYRAKEVQNPRPQSQARVGSRLKANKLLNDLRTNVGVDTALGVPAGPNSGLSVRLPQSNQTKE
jgi:hypothetical protein